MISRVGIGAAALALVLALALGGVVLTAGNAQAVKPRFNASGTAHCTVRGKGKYTPGIRTTPRAAVVWSFTGKLTCSTGTTGNSSVRITSGTVKAVSVPSTRSCTATPLPRVTADIKWKAVGGRVNPTHVVWSAGTTSTAGSRITTDLPGGGTTTVTGSYAGASAPAHLVGDVISFAPCSVTRGIKTYLVSGSSTLNVTGIGSGGSGGGGSSATCNNGAAAPAHYQSVVVFSLENRTWSGVGGVGFGAMPYLHSLAQSCSSFSSWTEADTSQNSLTQYGAQVTGALQPGLVDDCSPSATCSTTADNIFRQARAAGKSAINYVEGATTGCSASGNVAKHIPSLYMWGANDRTFCSAQTRPYSEFKPASPPSFAFITPSQCHDGHDCSNTTVDNWARTNVRAVLNSAGYKAGHVAVFIWYDEDSPVPNMQIAPTAKPGPFGSGGIGYGSTLKAWESMLGFPCLANACTAPNLRTVAGI